MLKGALTPNAGCFESTGEDMKITEDVKMSIKQLNTCFQTKIEELPVVAYSNVVKYVVKTALAYVTSFTKK